MRLIDADELKKCAIPCEIHNGTLTDLCIPLYQIDNAPTVEPNYCGNNPKWCESCVSKGKCASTRPQGDLISRSELIKAINDFYDEFFDGCFSSALITYAKGVDEIIENAQTVAVNCKKCDGYEAGYSSELKDAERP